MAVFNNVQEKDAYAYEKVEALVNEGMKKSAAVEQVKSLIGDISPATTWNRLRREEERRKEVSADGK